MKTRCFLKTLSWFALFRRSSRNYGRPRTLCPDLDGQKLWEARRWGWYNLRMKLLEARVTNYKNIEDSGPVTVDRITCLVGKNESGKTTFLEALYKLSPAGTT